MFVHSLTGYNSVHGCPCCVHAYPSHLSKLMHLGCRRDLPLNSPLRRRRYGPFHFVNAEGRRPAVLRTTQLMRDCLRVLREENLTHVCGFTGLPMLSNCIGFDWILHNVPDLMHLLGRLFLFVESTVCGGHGDSSRAKCWRQSNKDRKHREECESLDIFPTIWPSYRVRLSDNVRAVLLNPTDEHIARAYRPYLEKWLHLVGEKTNGMRVGELRELIAQIRRQLRQPGDYMFTPLTPPHLPWRLTRDAFHEVDRRILAMVFPHNTERVTKNGKSCLNLSAATGKTSKKVIMLLYIFPTVLAEGLRARIQTWSEADGAFSTHVGWTGAFVQ